VVRAASSTLESSRQLSTPSWRIHEAADAIAEQ